MNAPLPQTATAQAIKYIPLIDLCRSPTNPRRTFPADKLAEMADSIARHGVLQPVLVRAWPEGQAYPESLVFLRGNEQAPLPRYEIVAGERRCRAAAMAGTELVPAIVRDLSDNEVLEIQIVENLQREEVHPIEEAEGYQILMQRTGCTAEELAAKVGRSKAYIYARLKLTALCDEARDAFREGKLNASTALLIARIPGDKLQSEALSAIVDAWSGPLSFRNAAQVVQNRFTTRLGDAPFDLDKTDLLPDAGSCAACPSRSGNQPELFADITSADVCTDPGCFQRKREAWAELKRADAESAGRKVLDGKAAEKIIPSYALSPQNGYVDLDARCFDAKPVREIPPEPTQPEGEEDDTPEWDAYYEACDTWEEQKEGALPTYRELLADELHTLNIISIQQPRTGDIVDVVKESEILPILQAKGVLEEKPAPTKSDTGSFSKADDRSELEAKAKSETDYRALLLQRILDTVAGEPLQDADLVAIAEAFLDAVGTYSGRAKRAAEAVGAASAEALLESIPTRTPSEINRVLLALALGGEVHVEYWNFNTREATGLHAAAERAGIDAAAVKKQSAQIVDAPKPKKGKKKGATA